MLIHHVVEKFSQRFCSQGSVLWRRSRWSTRTLLPGCWSTSRGSLRETGRETRRETGRERGPWWREGVVWPEPPCWCSSWDGCRGTSIQTEDELLLYHLSPHFWILFLNNHFLHLSFEMGSSSQIRCGKECQRVYFITLVPDIPSLGRWCFEIPQFMS